MKEQNDSSLEKMNKENTQQTIKWLDQEKLTLIVFKLFQNTEEEHIFDNKVKDITKNPIDHYPL